MLRLNTQSLFLRQFEVTSYACFRKRCSSFYSPLSTTSISSFSAHAFLQRLTGVDRSQNKAQQEGLAMSTTPNESHHNGSDRHDTTLPTFAPSRPSEDPSSMQLDHNGARTCNNREQALERQVEQLKSENILLQHNLMLFHFPFSP